MRLSDVEQYDSFAILGSAFHGGAALRLLRGLRAARDPATARLAYVPFERAGSEPFLLQADAEGDVVLDAEAGAPRGRVALHAGDYPSAIETIRDAIAAGDVYQVCYTVRATVDGLRGSELARLMTATHVPRFLSWVRLPWGEEFISASPELFFDVNGRRIRTEPMKGTNRADASGTLLTSDKDRAELAMITDLLRNDLARVCRPRSVTVAAERRLLQLPYAVQTVSDIEGELQPGLTALDALAVLHPGGSVTGAPKNAALEMIRRMEEGPRGAYCGSLGYLDGPRAVFSLLIRTATRTGTDRWIYGVGGGIVYDSDADAELAELHIKLGALGWDTRS
jgi:anthranilate/para-aminobenzoate synthase component I